MERLEIPVSGEAERWVEAAERGDEVVLTRDGKTVATLRATTAALTDSPGVRALLMARQALAPLRAADAGQIVREQRDASAH